MPCRESHATNCGGYLQIVVETESTAPHVPDQVVAVVGPWRYYVEMKHLGQMTLAKCDLMVVTTSADPIADIGLMAATACMARYGRKTAGVKVGSAYAYALSLAHVPVSDVDS